MNKILITGAGGFIGSRVAEFLNNKGFIIYALIHKNFTNILKEKYISKNINILYGDITNVSEIRKKILKFNIDYLVHCAAIVSDVGKEKNFERINFNSVKELAQICIDLEMKKFIYISSTDVYGIKDFKGEKEEQLTLDNNLNNYYPKYKIKSEYWLQNNLPKKNFVIIRPAAVWGLGDKTLTPRIINFLKNSPYIIYFGQWKGLNRWPLSHVDNVSKSIYASIILEDLNGKAMNVLDNEYITIKEFYQMICNIYLPKKEFKEIYIAKWIMYFPALISTFISNFSSNKEPIFDPSLYALNVLSSNLDFNNDLFKESLFKSNQKITTLNEALYNAPKI